MEAGEADTAESPHNRGVSTLWDWWLTKECAGLWFLREGTVWLGLHLSSIYFNRGQCMNPEVTAGRTPTGVWGWRLRWGSCWVQVEVE